jgi:hypothetical protein
MVLFGDTTLPSPPHRSRRKTLKKGTKTHCRRLASIVLYGAPVTP